MKRVKELTDLANEKPIVIRMKNANEFKDLMIKLIEEEFSNMTMSEIKMSYKEYYQMSTNDSKYMFIKIIGDKAMEKIKSEMDDEIEIKVLNDDGRTITKVIKNPKNISKLSYLQNIDNLPYLRSKMETDDYIMYDYSGTFKRSIINEIVG